MGYYYPVGQAYCINGVHYDRGGNIEGRHSDDDESERLNSLGIAPGTCEGCYESPCVCLLDDAPCDPE